MKKATELRAWLHAKAPFLKAHPDKLHLFIEKGRVACRYGETLSYALHYQASLVVTDFTDHIDTLLVPLLAWIKDNQPDILLDLQKQDKALEFEAEILDNERVDLSIVLSLSERVIVSATARGYSAEHVGEPPMPETAGASAWTIYLAGDAIADNNGPIKPSA